MVISQWIHPKRSESNWKNKQSYIQWKFLSYLPSIANLFQVLAVERVKIFLFQSHWGFSSFYLCFKCPRKFHSNEETLHEIYLAACSCFISAKHCMNSFLVKAESTATLHLELVHESSIMEQLYIISTSDVSFVQLTMKRGTQPEKSQ